MENQSFLTHLSGLLRSIYPFGIGENPGSLTFLEHGINPGAGSFSTAKEGQRPFKASANQITVTTLDEFARDKGFFESKPVISILKVDVEGLEGQALLGGKELFASHLVKNILMEITPSENSDVIQKAFDMLINDYELAKYGTFSGPDRDHNWPMDGNLVQNMIAAKKGQLNLWWKVKE